MGFESPITIADTLSRIREHRLLLPAIQREFVWSADKVEWLFDSILQGYPIGSFLFWEVRDQKAKSFPYYEFLTKYRERFSTHSSEFNTTGHPDFQAVLDGQQRLTALNIGLYGTYAYKTPRAWWYDTEGAIPTRRLYLNLVGPAEEDDEQPGKKYDLKFLTEDEFNRAPTKWFRVGAILKMPNGYDVGRFLSSENLLQNEFAAQTMWKLHEAIFIQRIINYYLETESNMDKALNVFVRVNSGGQPLTLSDMLMSTAIASWKDKDARQEIHHLVAQIQSKGFGITKDFILKACLYLYSPDIRYRVSNFSAERVGIFETHWEAIQNSVLAAFDLARDFGYTEQSLTSTNALLPIIYWIHHSGIANTIRTQVNTRAERDIIRRWLHICLLKRVFGYASDAVLAAIRKAFTDDIGAGSYIRSGLVTFPTEAIATILRQRGRDADVTEEFLDSLLYTSYGDGLSFAILSLLSPHLDYKNGNFHADHLHPSSYFKNPDTLSRAGVISTDVATFLDPKHYNSILNLQHLDANENMSKQDKPLADWVAFESQRQQVSQAKFCADHHIPTDPTLLDIGRFPDFVQERRHILGDILRRELSTTA